jgi:hypothetical protein
MNLAGLELKVPPVPGRRALKALFGQAFADYQSRVPRWI